jgi:hypothetical protein
MTLNLNEALSDTQMMKKKKEKKRKRHITRIEKW